MKKYILLFTLAIAFGSCRTSETKEGTSLSPIEFQKKFEASPNAVLLDVRTMEEVQAERIKGQINFDYKAPEFEILIKGMDKSKPYFVYCSSGVRSSKAADKMRDEGYQNVYTLEGGLTAWKNAGLPVQN
jgi:rhodanese-related sulfurtransferase